ncbi:MAG: 2-oxo acid dehydrogenase subunit E2 [Sedimentisphaerales bacterium]|nr:2-oxo acid dehydrogenase subunit E2 [Sedimentisphaerales bacterium]
MEKHAEKEIRLTRIQKLVGERMLRSKRNKPCFYLRSRADMTELMGLRRKLGKSLGVRITSNTFFIRTLALAAVEFPIMLGRFEGDRIVIPTAVNVGFAVNSPHGLVVPVIRDADKKTLAEIAGLDILLTDKARHNKLTLSDMEGETIALSNLGAYGIDSFIGIAPPPTSVILSTGNVVRAIVPDGDGGRMRKVAELSLAVDQRVIDPAAAARCMDLIVEQLENPQRLI